MSQQSVWDDLDFLLEDLQGSSPASTTGGLQQSAPAPPSPPAFTWADLVDEDLEDMDNLQPDTMTDQQRLCRERYLAIEAMDEATSADNYDDDYDFSEEDDNYQVDVDDDESLDEPVKAPIHKATEHGIHLNTIERLWDTYDIQHRFAFFPLIPRHDDVRTEYPLRHTKELWYHRPGRSHMHQMLTAFNEPTPPLVAIEETASAAIPATSDTEEPTIEERPRFRSLLIARVCNVLDSTQKVVQATIELIR
ncbi:hypothetical protein MMC30_002299 [Trapelia coarctata]|nr:hypothetical protein [Trapelia coarctata]